MYKKGKNFKLMINLINNKKIKIYEEKLHFNYSQFPSPHNSQNQVKPLFFSPSHR